MSSSPPRKGSHFHGLAMGDPFLEIKFGRWQLKIYINGLIIYLSNSLMNVAPVYCLHMIDVWL